MMKIKKSELMVYIFFIIITFCKGIGLSSTNKVYIITYFFGLLLVFIKIFKDKFTKKQFITILSLLAIGILDFVIGDETTILFTAIALSCMKNIEVNKIIKIMFWTRLLSFILMIMLSTIGVIDNNVIRFYRATENGYIDRYSFGYVHPNLAHSSFSILVILWGYLYNKKVKFINIIICEIMNLILYHYTVSRTGFIILTLYLLLLYLTKKVKVINKNLPKLINISFIFFIGISFFIAWGYGKFEIISTLNTILTGRIRYMSLLLNGYSIPLIGHNNYGNILFDNGYFELLFHGGIFATIWFVLNQIKTNKILEKRNIQQECVLTIFFLFYSVTESYYASVLMNPSLLFLSYYIFETTNNRIKNS